MANFKTVAITNETRQNLERFLRIGKFDVIQSSIFYEEMSKSILYPTDDFHLFAHQFDAIKSLLSYNEDFFVLQMGFENGFFSNQIDMYVCNHGLPYSEYAEIWLDSITIIAPASWKWLLLIDEALDGGLGVLLGDREIIDQFNNSYANAGLDVVMFVEYFRRFDRDDHALNYMMDILRLLEDNRANRTGDGSMFGNSLRSLILR